MITHIEYQLEYDWATGVDFNGANVSKSCDLFMEMLVDAIKSRYPNAAVSVEVGESYKSEIVIRYDDQPTSVSRDGDTDDNFDVIENIASDVFIDDWYVYDDEPISDL